MATNKAVAIATGISLVAYGALYFAQGTPHYVLEGQATLTCEAGICTGPIVGILTPAGTSAIPDATVSDSGIAVNDGGPIDIGSADLGVNLDATPIFDSGSTPPPTSNKGIYVAASDPGQQFNYPHPTLIKPAVGASVTDPTFNVAARRVFDWGSHEYSQLEPFSSDESLLLLLDFSAGNTYKVLNYPSLTVKRALTASYTNVRWIPNTHTLMYFENSPPLRVRTLNLDTGEDKLVYLESLPYYKGSQVQEKLSDAGWTIIWAHSGNGATLRALNVLTGQVGGSIGIAALFPAACAPYIDGAGVSHTLEPNWVAPSPSSKYIAVMWHRDGTARCSGMELFDIKTGAFVRNVYDGHSHGDLGMTSSGKEFYLSNELYSSNFMLYYLDGSGTKRLRVADWGAMGHVACHSTRVTNTCLISGTFAQKGDGTPYLDPGPKFVGFREMYTISVEGPQMGSLRRLFHHRSKGDDYWALPLGADSAKGRYVIFNSDWEVGNSHQSPYVIDLQN